MKRDWWKIRHVLLEVRLGNELDGLDETDDIICYHFDLCRQAGFVKGTLLTWEGQEAADLLQDADLLHHARLDLPCMPWFVLKPWLARQLLPNGEHEEQDE